MAVQEFGRGMNNKVDAKCERLLQIRRRKSIVDGTPGPVLMGNIRQCLYIDTGQGWIGRCFAVQHFNAAILLEMALHGINIFQVGKNGFYAELPENIF